MSDEKEKQPKLPQVWVKDDDTFDEKMWVSQDQDTKRVVVGREKRPGNPEVVTTNLIFTIKRPTYKDLIQIKRECTEYKQEFGIYWTDPDKQNQKRLRKLLRGWNLDKLWGEEYRFTSVEGVVTDQAMMVLMKLDPAIIKELIERIRERFDG